MHKRINYCLSVWRVQLPAGAAASSQQYLLPTAATQNLHTPACYNPAAAAAAGFLATGVTDMTSTAAAPVIASHSNDNNSVSDAVSFTSCYFRPPFADYRTVYFNVLLDSYSSFCILVLLFNNF